MKLPSKVTIVEVGPRDGFQNEKQFIPTDEKSTSSMPWQGPA